MTTNRKLGWPIIWIGLACLLLALPVFAGKGGKAPNPNSGHGKITQVSASSITVQPKNGDAKTYSITASTVVSLDDKASSAADLAVGEHAKIKSDDGTTALKIKAHTKHFKKTALG